MRKVAIVTDTTACVPQEQVARYDIEVVPVQLIIEDKTYRDGIDITPTEFYNLLRKSKKLPTTSSSSPNPYLEAYQNASRKAQSILCLTEPSKFSAMFDSARVAMYTAKTTLRNVAIEVLECTTAAAGQGLVALAAAKAAAMDKPLNEVREIAESIMSRVNLYATLDTLTYLVRSGRVPQAAALVNSILSIKPIFTLNHSDAHTVALPRTMKSAIDRMLKLMGSSAAKGQPLHVVVMHADALGEAITLKDRITSQFECREIFITEFTPVMGVHTGPGLIGVAFYSEEPGAQFPT
ncbi:MAG TPA: DegV family protein, partial [Dehalococcoidales bacterium]|nr:DegV family protein [Dehalococcoidales bacterium]